MEFQLSYFKSQKMMLLKCCIQYASKFGKLSHDHRTGKGQLAFQSQRKARPKKVQTTVQLHSFHILARSWSKSFKVDFSSSWAKNVQMYMLSFEEAEETKIKLPTPLNHQKNKRVPGKYLLLLYWLCQSLWLCGSQQTGKFWKRWEYQTTWPASWETYMQIRKQQLELDMEQQTGSKQDKEYIKAVYCHPIYLTYMQSTS